MEGCPTVLVTHTDTLQICGGKKGNGRQSVIGGWGCEAYGDSKDPGDRKTILGFRGTGFCHLTLRSYDDDAFGCPTFRSTELDLEHTRNYVQEEIITWPEKPPHVTARSSLAKRNYQRK